MNQYEPCTGHYPTRKVCCIAIADVLVYEDDVLSNRPYTVYIAVYMAVLYTKQGAVELFKVLVKSTHHPHWLPQQTRIGRRTAQTSNLEYLDSVPSRLDLQM